MRTLIALVLGMISLSLQAQITKDSVATGPGNSDQVWYSLKEGEVKKNSLKDWHIGFEISGITSSLLFNSGAGHSLYVYPKGDTTDWNNIDTNGLSTWPAMINSDTSWAVGAFNQNVNLKNELDLGWGAYNMTNHWVVGDSIFIIKTLEGAAMKLWIERLAGGAYDFKYADLDGGNEKTGSLAKKDYSGKNFGYFNLMTGTAVDIEPLAADWDLVFTKYTTKIAIGPGMYLPYGVSGVLANAGTAITKVYPVDDPESFDDFKDAKKHSPINAIGYSWKRFDFPNSKYIIEDSTVHLVRTSQGTIWKVVMTGYGGSTNGQMNFYKELLDATGTVELSANRQELMVYPNPVVQGDEIRVSSYSPSSTNGSMSLIGLDGKVIWKRSIDTSLATYQISTSGLNQGVYFVRLTDGANVTTKKVVIQ